MASTTEQSESLDGLVRKYCVHNRASVQTNVNKLYKRCTRRHDGQTAGLGKKINIFVQIRDNYDTVEVSATRGTTALV
jgi:hypothetical protein